MSIPECSTSNKPSRRSSDFSIARILGDIDDRDVSRDHEEVDDHVTTEQRFEWLQCTRYKPPRLPRSRRREGAQRRKLGRNPRIPFSSGQVSVLEQRFRQSQYLSSADVAELAAFLALSETRVKIWFQNRRARERRDRETQQQQQQSPCSESMNCDDVMREPRVQMSPEASLRGLNLSLAEMRMSATAAALTGIARARELISAASKHHGSGSAFDPVSSLALVSPRHFSASTIKCSPGD